MNVSDSVTSTNSLLFPDLSRLLANTSESSFAFNGSDVTATSVNGSSSAEKNIGGNDVFETSMASFGDVDEEYARFLHRVGQNLIIYYCPFLVLFGTVGNVLSIMVFSGKNMKTSTMSVYTRFMAVNDLAALYTGPVYYFMNACCSVNINLYSDIICRSYKFRVFLFTDVSAYTIMSLTAERLCSVILPHKVKLLCSKRTSRYVIVLVFVVIAVANAPLIAWTHLLDVTDPETNTTERVCRFEPSEELEQAWFAFDLAKFCVLPVSFITVSNILLLTQLYGGRICRILMCRGGSEADTDVTEVSRKANNRRQKSMTLMLISVSAVFLVCNLPVVLFPVHLVVLPTAAEQELATIISDLLMFTNNTLNFVLYCACGTRFRQELVAMLCFWRVSNSTPKTAVSIS